MDWIHLAQDSDQVVVSYEHHNESSGFIKHGDFLDEPRNYEVVKKASACSYLYT